MINFLICFDILFTILDLDISEIEIFHSQKDCWHSRGIEIFQGYTIYQICKYIVYLQKIYINSNSTNLI
jgi:hypothetical protein